MKPQSSDSHFLHLKEFENKSVSAESLIIIIFFTTFQGNMATIVAAVFLFVLPTVLSQSLTPRGPRPIPGRGDSPQPTPPPILPELDQQGCKSEFHFRYFAANNYFFLSAFYLEYPPAPLKKQEVNTLQSSHYSHCL